MNKKINLKIQQIKEGASIDDPKQEKTLMEE